MILGITGSIRCKSDAKRLKEITLQIKDEHMLNVAVEKIGRDQTLSNTEVCLAASLFSVHKYGLDFEVINLKKHVRGNSLINTKNIKKLVKAAKGIIIASPVYFGDRSFLINLFLNYLNRKSLLKDMIAGCISVGAKRNGGQETTNIFILKEAIDAGAYVVGNGPPISQYGGTAWAGNLGTIREDKFGISTSMSTGRKVSELVSLFNIKTASPMKKLKVSFWIMRDSRNTILNEVKKLTEHAGKKVDFNIKWDIIDFNSMKFHQCMACSRCPWFQDKRNLYKCKIKKDDFGMNYKRLVDTDAILVCGYHPANSYNVKDIFQKVLERTRIIRRDNFLLSNVPVTSLSVEEPPNMSLFSLKVMTSFLRHNTVIYPPLKVCYLKNEKVNGVDNEFIDFLNFSMKIKNGKQTTYNEQTAFYLPIGYSTK